MTELVVGSTIAPFKADSNEHMDWVDNAAELASDAQAAGFDAVTFLAVLELDARGTDVYDDLLSHIASVAVLNDGVFGEHWTFSIDDGSTLVDGSNRLVRICTGRNLIQEYATRQADTSHILFLDSDIRVPSDSVSRLLELDYPLVGGDVPSYCQQLNHITMHNGIACDRRWNTAGFLMVRREAFTKLHWRYDLDRGMTDDPCYDADAIEAGFGGTLVRRDLQAWHRPLQPLENRGHDLERKL